MFRCTSLGHHSWLLSTESTRLLVDPLLCARFGFTDAIELRVYPPRVFDFDLFPAIDAVYLTHEHEGHFEIASLNLLSRQIPIYMSSRSSVATRTLLEEMGFIVRLVHPGVRVDLGDLSLLPMTANQVKNGVIEEWDVLSYLVWDREGHGSFFAEGDMKATPATWKLARTVIKEPGLWALTTNASVYDFSLFWEMPRDRSLHEYVQATVAEHKSLSQGWVSPTATLVVGGGWAFGGEQAWLNRNHFPYENEDAAKVLGALLPGERVLAPQPGTTIVMKDGRIQEVEAATPFVKAAPKAEWPARCARGDVQFIESYTPVTGRTDLSEAEADELREELDGFAAHLYGSDVFRHLYSLTDTDIGGKKPTFAFLLKADDAEGAYVMEYQPQACAFIPVECEDPIAEYLAVYECWGTDLLAHFRAEVSPNAQGFGRHREYNANPTAFAFTVSTQLFVYMHQLRHPERFLRLYRTVLASQKRVSPLIGRGPGA